MRILVTCPPMLGLIDEFKPLFLEKELDIHCPQVVQTLSVVELEALVPKFDGWIMGDDPASKTVFEAGKKGNLKAAVKWGVGIDNVDFEAAKELGIPIANTPRMFGGEVADVAVGYVIALARETFWIDRQVRNGYWIKPCGVSLAGKTVALVGFGDIGKNTAKRLLAFDLKVIAYDPCLQAQASLSQVESAVWPDRIGEADFVIVTCSLTKDNYHLLDAEIFRKLKPGVRIVNVARGPLIDEEALINSLSSGRVHSVALDVFEVEPLPLDSRLRNFEQCIFGSHNSSNTVDAVRRASRQAIEILFQYLGV